jgi:hypothetical protein
MYHLRSYISDESNSKSSSDLNISTYQVIYFHFYNIIIKRPFQLRHHMVLETIRYQQPQIEG